MASKSSDFEPSAPPFPPGGRGLQDQNENEPLIQGQGHTYAASPSSYHPVAYGQPPPPPPPPPPMFYQQYMSPSPPVYGTPVWQKETRPEWSTNLCNCMADIPICLFGCLCPCLLFGKVAEKLDDGLTSCLAPALVWYIVQQFTSLGCIYSCGYRTKLRARYNLPERPLPDCLVHWLCWPCAFCQEYRELRIRRRAEEARRATSVMPPPQQFMNY